MQLGNPPGLLETTTGSAGDYVHLPIPGLSTVLRPTHQGSSGAAIGRADATRLLEASVGLAEVSTEETLAGDVSGDGTLSAYDAALLLRRGNGDMTPFPAVSQCGSEWLFFPAPASAPNQTLIEPRIADCSAGAIEYSPLGGPASGQGFHGILIGDFDGSWQP